MARRRKSRGPKGEHIALGVAAVAAVGVGIYFVTRTKPATPEFERAMLDSRPGDGVFFLPWLVMYRAGLLTDELRLGDAAHNTEVIGRGLTAAGQIAARPNDPDALKRALCTRYKEAMLAGTIREIPAGYSEQLKTFARTQLDAWERGCLGVNVTIAAPT